jgi:hypothetical protein
LPGDALCVLSSGGSMTKQELRYVRRIDRAVHKLIERLCREFPEEFVHDNTPTRERVLRIIDQIQLCTYMLRDGLKNRKMLASAKKFLKKYQSKV